MKVTNNTAYATIGCDVQLSENDRLALGIELDKVINWLEADAVAPTRTEAPSEAINNLAAFVSKFAIRPSLSNVFADSPEDFKSIEEPYLPADKTITAVEPASTDDVITVKIANFKNVARLKIIIHRASDASIARINDILNSADVKRVPCISFRCINKRKEEVVNELIDAGFQIVSNGVNQSLRL